jgi:phosphatidylinositol phospholipase C epsilon
MFFLVVHGVVAEEPYTILKVTQDTTAAEVINNALQKSGRTAESAREYVLIEEVARGWDAKEKDLPPTQRVLDSHEKPLQSQSHWKGDGKFILKRTGNDPSSRAWLSSISARGNRFTGSEGSRGDKASRESDELQHWGDDDNFLVCVHNVSPEIPYAILKVSWGLGLFLKVSNPQFNFKTLFLFSLRCP